MATAVRLCDWATPRPDCLTTRPVPGHDQGHRQWKCRAHRRHGHAQTNTTKNQHTEISRNPQSDKARWIRAQPESSPHQQILETVWELQQDDRDHTVEYAALRTALRLTKKLTITDAELREECLALSRMAPGYFMAREDRVELNIKPENVLATIHAYVDDLPQADEEQT